jgi:hypothetical protein
MPMNTNNVDASVAANTMFGLTAAVIAGVDDAQWFTADVQKVTFRKRKHLLLGILFSCPGFGCVDRSLVLQWDMLLLRCIWTLLTT